VKFQVKFLSVLTPCSVVDGYQRFRGPCCLHFPEDKNVGILPEHYTASQPARTHFGRYFQLIINIHPII